MVRGCRHRSGRVLARERLRPPPQPYSQPQGQAHWLSAGPWLGSHTPQQQRTHTHGHAHTPVLPSLKGQTGHPPTSHLNFGSSSPTPEAFGSSLPLPWAPKSQTQDLQKPWAPSRMPSVPSQGTLGQELGSQALLTWWAQQGALSLAVSLTIPEEPLPASRAATHSSTYPQKLHAPATGAGLLPLPPTAWSELCPTRLDSLVKT